MGENIVEVKSDESSFIDLDNVEFGDDEKWLLDSEFLSDQQAADDSQDEDVLNTGFLMESSPRRKLEKITFVRQHGGYLKLLNIEYSIGHRNHHQGRNKNVQNRKRKFFKNLEKDFGNDTFSMDVSSDNIIDDICFKMGGLKLDSPVRTETLKEAQVKIIKEGLKVDENGAGPPPSDKNQVPKSNPGISKLPRVSNVNNCVPPSGGGSVIGQGLLNPVAKVELLKNVQDKKTPTKEPKLPRLVTVTGSNVSTAKPKMNEFPKKALGNSNGQASLITQISVGLRAQPKTENQRPPAWNKAPAARKTSQIGSKKK